jgi:hypothetical protein
MTAKILRPIAGRGAALLLAAVSCGCAMSDAKLGGLVADRANYEVLNCTQLAGSEASFKARLAELDGLMAKASNDPGGGLVSATTYKPEAIAARGSLDAVHSVQAEKNCTPPAPATPPAAAKPAARAKR